MFTFPIHLFNPESIQLRVGGSTVTGGESLSGETDVIRTDGGGYWVIQMQGIELRTDALLKAWQAWEDHLDNGATKVLVPVPELRQAPRPIVGGCPGRPSQLAPGDPDNPFFPEAIGFASPWITAKVVDAADLRATQVTIEITEGARLEGGERFSIDHATAGRRLYRVGRVISRTGQQATVTIRPPLREAVVANEPADFDWPSMVAVLVPETEIAPDVRFGRYARTNITFRESF